MAIGNAASDVAAEIAGMDHARAVAKLAPFDRPMSCAEIEHHARVIAAVINANRKLEQLRERTRSLESALERYRSRRSELAA
jgi:hypothetical protein